MSQMNLYSYCKLARVPKVGAVPVVVAVLSGLSLTLIFAAFGESLLMAVGIGAIVSALFAFFCWLIYRYRAGSAKMLNSYIDEDGGQGMLSDFTMARPFVDDQFRVGKHYLYIRNKYGRDAFIRDSEFSLEIEDYNRMHFDYAIEDSPTAFHFFEHLPSLKVMVYDRPWNRDCEFPGKNYKRCFDWEMIKNIVSVNDRLPDWLMKDEKE